ncbi:GDSL-type esterase/lipase family protein [uncultured Sphingomonas sp.]|uniref:SGNH/GDSL hydrolase family protein n=1 Tax=uncultured Sphingomonas sp. TaxID=158754 RepID=UPI0025FB5D43|nr:GDSL-type esterase/lipase family protein [uncultured Sphingomonas sp.]
MTAANRATESRLWWLGDRMAVLVLGLIAGFVVGLSFAGDGRIALPGSPAPAASPVPPVAPGASSTGTDAAPATPTTVPAVAARTVDGPIDPQVVARMKRDGVLRVGVFGDSFGNGIWDALYRQLPKDDGFEVLKFAKEATGFTRYRVLDLEKRAREQLATQPVDAAVISFGANDAQAVFADGHLHPLMSDGWKQVIGDRIDAFVAAVRSTGAVVYWVGLPVMRDPKLDVEMQAMDAFYADHMRRLGVPFLDSRPLTLDAEGKYNAYLPDLKTGKPMLMRTGDGLHMIGVGYQRLTSSVATDLRRYADRTRREAGRPLPTPTPTEAAR